MKEKKIIIVCDLCKMPVERFARRYEFRVFPVIFPKNRGMKLDICQDCVEAIRARRRMQEGEQI